MKLTSNKGINEISQWEKVFDAAFHCFSAGRAAPALCKYNKAPSVVTMHGQHWKHHHLPLFLSLSLPLHPLSLSSSPPHCLIQLLIWQQSKEINEVLQRKESFTARGIVGRRSEMRIWWGGGLKTVYLNECLFGLKHQWDFWLKATTFQSTCVLGCLDFVNNLKSGVYSF